MPATPRRCDALARIRLKVAFLAALAALAACAPATAARPDRDSRVITADDIERVKANTAYEAIVRLHAEFLSARGQSSIAGADAQREPMVYLDNAFVGRVASLRGISARQIASIRMLRMAEATQKYGTGHTAGVIEITTKR
jgi:hypothetical protein